MSYEAFREQCAEACINAMLDAGKKRNARKANPLLCRCISNFYALLVFSERD